MYTVPSELLVNIPDDGAAPSDNLMWIGEAHPDQRSPQDHQAQRLDGGGESNGWYAKCKQADAARIEMQVIICGSLLWPGWMGVDCRRPVF